MLQRHAAVEVLYRSRMFRLRTLGFFLDQLEDPRRARQRVLQLRDHAGYLVERFRVLVRVAEQAGQLTHRHRAAKKSDETCRMTASDGETGAQDRHPRVHHVVHKAGARVCQGGEKDCPQRTLLKPFVDLVEPAEHPVLLPVGLHHLLVADHLIDQRGLFPSRLRLQKKHVVSPRRDKLRHK